MRSAMIQLTTGFGHAQHAGHLHQKKVRVRSLCADMKLEVITQRNISGGNLQFSECLLQASIPCLPRHADGSVIHIQWKSDLSTSVLAIESTEVSHTGDDYHGLSYYSGLLSLFSVLLLLFLVFYFYSKSSSDYSSDITSESWFYLESRIHKDTTSPLSRHESTVPKRDRWNLQNEEMM